MKNPNGYGSVTKLSGNRRRPFWVRKTIGWNEKGYPIYETIGYTVTREEGNILLAEYNNNPWDVDGAKITLNELFELWKEKKLPKLGKANQNSLRSAYRHCKKYSELRYKEIKAYHMQDCIDNCGRGYSTQGTIKNLWGHLDKFALELDITSRCYSDLLTSEPVPETNRNRFSDEEIESIWALYNEYKAGKDFGDLPVSWIDSVLIFLYSGFRISELLGMRVSDIDLKAQTFKGGIKTDAGKKRIVPIHSLIFDMVKNRVEKDNEYLFMFNDKKVSPNQYRDCYWKKLMEYLGIEKTPHECRHTFESRLDSAGANRKCIDLMMGHKSKDVGNRVYNHKTIQDLKIAIELVTH